MGGSSDPHPAHGPCGWKGPCRPLEIQGYKERRRSRLMDEQYPRHPWDCRRSYGTDEKLQDGSLWQRSLRLYSKGWPIPPASRCDSAWLCVQHPFQTWLHLRRRQSQRAQPQAELQAPFRRHRGDNHCSRTDPQAGLAQFCGDIQGPQQDQTDAQRARQPFGRTRQGTSAAPVQKPQDRTGRGLSDAHHQEDGLPNCHRFLQGDFRWNHRCEWRDHTVWAHRECRPQSWKRTP